MERKKRGRGGAEVDVLIYWETYPFQWKGLLG